MSFFNPATRTDEELQKEVEMGKIDDFKRTDSGGIQSYQSLRNGDTYLKDMEPAENSKGHQQTDFIISDGHISEIRSHDDDD